MDDNDGALKEIKNLHDGSNLLIILPHISVRKLWGQIPCGTYTILLSVPHPQL
jgi:hypothetical protein